MTFFMGLPTRFTRSISEATRQEEEMTGQEPYDIKTYHQACERIRVLREIIEDTAHPKGVRQALLPELRKLEDFWGVEGNPYNCEKA